MALYVKWKGYLRGRAFGWRLKNIDKHPKALLVEIDLEAQESLDMNSHLWERIPEVHLQTCDVWLVGIDGVLSKDRIEELMEVLEWDGSATTIQNHPDLDALIQWTSLQDKKSPKFFRAGYLKPWDWTPRRKEQGANPEGKSIADQFDNTFGSQLRAIAGSVMKRSAPDSTTPKPESGSGPTSTPPAENQDADLPPEHASLSDPPPGPPKAFGGAALPEAPDEVPF